jgi:hypothetical protein
MLEDWVEELLNMSLGLPNSQVYPPLRTIPSTASSHNYGRRSPQRMATSYLSPAPSSRSNLSGSPHPPDAPASSANRMSMSWNQTPSQSRWAMVPCVACNAENKQTFTCVQCNNDSFCDDCWGKERPHRPGAVGMDGLPHEKTNRLVVERLRQILDPYRSPEVQQSLHRNDEDTTWFGIARDSANLPIFQDYGRYATIMAESQSPEVNVRYPQLVSFIGQTGMKSAIPRLNVH